MGNKEIFELEPLFSDVQMNRIFPDGKTFVDCTPKQTTEIILQTYLNQKDEPGFDLSSFVSAHFELPHVFASDYHTNTKESVEEHIHELWPVLTRMPDLQKGSLIPLPHSYIVPGGRFGEVYYWDSYFTMLGLAVSDKVEMIENMVNNFTHLIQTLGFIPNGNRTYYLGRSQPPFYALMVQLLASIKGKEILATYLQALELEYQFWMKGSNELNDQQNALFHVVQLKDGEMLNRYWDSNDTARPESFREDVELTHQSKQDPKLLYRHLRAGAESGWDYSHRWFREGSNFATIHTTEIIPVDLNALMVYLEQTIAAAYGVTGNEKLAAEWFVAAVAAHDFAVVD